MDNQKYVCFSGHRSLSNQTLSTIKPLLEREIKLTLKDGCQLFYSAEAGDFDNLVLDTLSEFRKSHPNIKIVALHSIYKRKTITKADSIVKPPKFAEAFQKVIKNAYCLICYVNEIGGAFSLMEYAIRTKVKVINLAESSDYK